MDSTVKLLRFSVLVLGLGSLSAHAAASKDITLKIGPGLPDYHIHLSTSPCIDLSKPALQAIGQMDISAANAGAAQTIKVGAVPTAAPDLLLNSFEAIDIDSDGYTDLSAFRQAAGTGQTVRQYWLFDKASGQFEKTALAKQLEELEASELVPDPATHTLEARYHSATSKFYETYAIRDGELVLLKTYEQNCSSRPCKEVRKDIADGASPPVAAKPAS